MRSPENPAVSLMSRRIIVGRSTQDYLGTSLQVKLKAIAVNYMSGQISAERAKRRGREFIDREFRTLLAVSRSRVEQGIRRRVGLPPEKRAELERWRDGYIHDFEEIIDSYRGRQSRR